MRKLKTLSLLGWVLIPGYWALIGPKKVMCYEGESLSVRCHYEESFTENTKFWCKDSILTLCSSLLIKTSSEDLVEKDRVSIRDNREERYFEITMFKLNREDAGTYQCGIERGILNDRHYIEVTVSSDPKQTSTTEELTSTGPPASGGSKEQELYILIYCIIPLFLLLIVAAVVLFTISRKKKKGLGWTRKKGGTFEGMVFVHNMADSSCEQSIPHHLLGSNGTGLYSNVEVHPENNNEELPPQVKSPGNKDEVSYATVTISNPQNRFIYANVGFVPTPVLSKSQEVFYTEVAKRSTE